MVRDEGADTVAADYRVAIVGGGISGLATAFYLYWEAKKAQRPVTLHVLDASPRWGGVIHTVREAGFIVEGGPDSILSFKPAGIGLWEDLGLLDDVMGTSPAQQGSFVYSRGALHPLPEGLTLMIPARLGPLFRTRLVSWRGKLRAALDLVRTWYPDGRDISVARFVSAYLGQEVFDRVVEPLFAGIYGGDARALSLRATYPQLLAVAREHGSLLRGLLIQRRRASQPRGQARWTPFVTLRQGLSQMVEALVAQLADVQWHANTRVVRVIHTGSRTGPWEVHTAREERLRCDAVVLALPAPAAAHVVGDLDPDLAHRLSDIPYTPVVTVSLAYPRNAVAHPLAGYGFIVPRVEGRALLACTWTSSKFPHRAPEGYVLIRCFLRPEAAADAMEAPDAEVLAVVQRELKDILDLQAPAEQVWVFRWPLGLPQYVLGHLERVADIESRASAWPGLYLVGNAFHGVGIPDCIARGRAVVENLVHGNACS